MRAIVQDEYGGPEVLRLEEIERPVPPRGRVLVRVHAAGVDQGVWHVMAGEPRAVRAAMGWRRPRQRVPGGDLAGVVEAVGEGVDELAPGDRVFGRGEGSFAEFALARPGALARLPEGVGFEQAAALPVSGSAAANALRTARLLAGERVLVLGAGGGVGSFAVQLAALAGAHVTGVASTGKLALLRGLGVDAVVDYTTTPLTGTFDVILDTGGGRPLPELRRLLAPRGRLVLVGSETGEGLGRMVRAGLLSPFTGQRLAGLVSSEPTALLEELGGLLAAGSLRSCVDRVLPLEEAAEAIRELRAGRVAGKLVLAVA